jgi:hypothetical protein
MKLTTMTQVTMDGVVQGNGGQMRTAAAASALEPVNQRRVDAAVIDEIRGRPPG